VAGEHARDRDAALLVVDLGDPACVEQVEVVRGTLHDRRVTLIERSDSAGAPAEVPADGESDPFAVRLPTLLLANKADRLTDADAELQAFLEVLGLRYPDVVIDHDPNNFQFPATATHYEVRARFSDSDVRKSGPSPSRCSARSASPTRPRPEA
jgi:hypothetical protein